MMLHELEKALKHGYILSDITTCLAWGAPGVGKTHLRCYLFSQLPPFIRVSTACMEPAQRALLAPPMEGGEVKCQPVNIQQFKAIVAEEVREGAHEIVEVEETHDGKVDPSPLHPGDLAVSQATADSNLTAAPGTVASRAGHPVSSYTQRGIEGELTSSPVPAIESSEVQGHPAQLLPETSEILRLMETSSGTKPMQKVHWVHFIDSGGQGEFHELLAALARDITLLLPVIKLSEKLSDVPDAEYYDHDSKCFKLGRFTLTNEQLLLQVAQFAFYHQPKFPFPYTEATPDHPKVMVVGTFKDQENKEESIQAKNELLRESLAPLQKQQLLIPRSHQEIIFPVNATLAGQEGEDPMASELLSAIQKHAPRLRIRLPSRWKLLELEVRKLDRKVVKRNKCSEIARVLGFESENGVEAALLYLHEANFFFYDPEILPGIVFVDPQAIIGVFTQLFELFMRLHDATESEVVSERDQRFRDQALFTVNMIVSLDIAFERDLLSSEDVIKLLQHKLIAARVLLNGQDSYYLMPSLLRALEASEVTRPEFTAADPLLVTFPTGWAPIGLFCALLVGLLSATSPLQWDVPSLSSCHIRALHKNDMELSVTGESSTITMINVATHYEIFPSETFPSSLLSRVLKQIDTCLKRACSKFSYRVTHRFAFLCSCGQLPVHPAAVSVTHEVECSKDPKRTVPLSAKQIVWFQHQTTLQGSPYRVPSEASQSYPYTGPLSHRKIDPTYPGITFLGKPLLESVDSQGGELSLPGISLVVPPTAVRQGLVIDVMIWPCLSGPFVPPEGYELTSPVYLISPAFSFEQDVELTLHHFASLTTDSDCDRMVFVSASSSPNFSRGHPEYLFRVFRKGSFTKNSSICTVKIGHFCEIATARQCTANEPEARPGGCAEENIYSVQLYRSKFATMTDVFIFGLSLCQPVYLQDLKSSLQEQFPGLWLWRTVKQPVRLKVSAVRLKIPSDVHGWSIVPDKNPPEVSQEEVDFPLHHPDKPFPDAYPPRIVLQALPLIHNPQTTTCSLKVLGITENVEFNLMLSKGEERSIAVAAAGTVLPMTFEQRSVTSDPGVAGCQMVPASQDQRTACLTPRTQPNLKLLQSLNIGEKRIRIIDSVAANWEEVAIALDFDVPEIATVRLECHFQPKPACRMILSNWLKGQGCQPPTWERLVEALSDANFLSLAQDLQQILGP